MKYGILVNISTDNIGDDIQSYAQRRFLPSVDYVIDREKTDIFGLDTPEDETVSVIMNSWYMYQKFNWPPSPAINPLFLSMHFSREDYFGIGDRFLEGLGAEYLRHYGPIGARDQSTLEFLQSKGIDSYLSGCMTLTLTLPGEAEKSDEVILTDVRDDIALSLKESHPDIQWEQVTHEVNPLVYREKPIEERFSEVEALLQKYRNAKCVITERLHCALPCLALGTPVILVYRPEYLDRMSSFLPLLHTISTKELNNTGFCYDLDSPPENPREYLRFREDLEKRCERFIRQAEQGEYPKRFTASIEKRLIWQKGLINESEVRFRKVIEDQGDWIVQLETERSRNEEFPGSNHMTKGKETMDTNMKELEARDNNLEKRIMALNVELDSAKKEICGVQERLAAQTKVSEELAAENGKLLKHISELEVKLRDAEKSAEELDSAQKKICGLENRLKEAEISVFNLRKNAESMEIKAVDRLMKQSETLTAVSKRYSEMKMAFEKADKLYHDSKKRADDLQTQLDTATALVNKKGGK